MNYLQDLLNLTEEKLTRAKFVSISLGLLFVYIILASIGNVLSTVLILGVGDLCTLLGFSIILLFSVRANLRTKLFDYVNKEIKGKSLDA
jgi:hypothetical protein